MDYCETAVKLAPNNGDFLDSRGLARALTGNVTGAIADFEAAVRLAKKAQQPSDPNATREFITTRTAWIAALQAGTAPAEVFDAATLAGLRGR
jgi:hypothetical protein